MFPAQVGEVTTMTFMTMRHFSLSLNLWLLHGLHIFFIGSWGELEEKFYEHFYIVVHETRMSYLTLVCQGHGEFVFGFVKPFRDIKNQ